MREADAVIPFAASILPFNILVSQMESEHRSLFQNPNLEKLSN